MCYVVVLSTSSDTDLAQFNSDLLRFSPRLPELAVNASLKYRHRWYVGSRSICSCTFRHLHSVELGFGAPVEWYPEDDDEVEATLQFIGLIRRLLDDGASVDCIDIWEDDSPDAVVPPEITVDLSLVGNEEFRFFENHRFVFLRHA